MEQPGMIHTMIDDGDDSTFEIAITREAMDMISGSPGIGEAEFVDRFADDAEALVADMDVIGPKDAEGRIMITAYWVNQLQPWLGEGRTMGVDAWGRLN